MTLCFILLAAAAAYAIVWMGAWLWCLVNADSEGGKQ